MNKKKTSTSSKDIELQNKVRDISSFCKKNRIPLFIAAWCPSAVGENKKKDDGYLYEMQSAVRLDIDIERKSKTKDRFPQFLGGILGFDRTKYDR